MVECKLLSLYHGIGALLKSESLTLTFDYGTRYTAVVCSQTNPTDLESNSVSVIELSV